MLEVSNIVVNLQDLRGKDGDEEHAIRRALLKKLHIKPDELRSFTVHKRSIDARKRNNVQLLYTLLVSLSSGNNGERALLQKAQRNKAIGNHIKEHVPIVYHAPTLQATHLVERPIVVGAGCAGLFCALALAEAGLNPLLVERGEAAYARTKTIEHFNATGELNPESNIQFGLGGAGTFSDGKLSTGTKSPLHRHILEVFVEAGADASILFDAKPHVGSDVLPHVVQTICDKIVALGGEVRFSTKMSELVIESGKIAGVRLVTTAADGNKVEQLEHANHVVLAAGHSARDVYRMLKEQGVALDRKTFAMGYRIEHLQKTINKSQYGPFAEHPNLGAAPYKLVQHLDQGRSAFSFCMCPGGYVVAAASEPEQVCTNGMSYSDRAGVNANAGLLANVFPEDLQGDDVLAGIGLQIDCERRAYDAGGGAYVAPAQLVGDFLKNQRSTAPGSILPTYPRGVRWTNTEGLLPSYITDTLRAALPKLDRKIAGYAAADAVLTGVETRSSSPVRVVRTENFQSVSTPGLWPCGEGAGYAGGIMSAATDGLRVAEALVDTLSK